MALASDEHFLEPKKRGETMTAAGRVNETVVHVKNVTVRIKNQVVLERINLQLDEGKIYGIIGRNGSGKTMLLRVLCGLVRPSEGEVWVLGREIGRAGAFPDEVGAVIETPGFLPQYSGLKNLKLLASLRNRIDEDDIREAIRLVGLDPENKKPVRTYSLGMRQRLGLAQAIMEKPRLLLLDEPSNGLDQEGVRDLHILLRNLRSKGVTILLTSHSREEIETLCDAVYYMERGRLEALPEVQGSLPIEKHL
jgi:ABC-type multidrug transport system, ATPase component